MNPYHVDSLLQLSDVCRMQEDQEMARDLIGKGQVERGEGRVGVACLNHLENWERGVCVRVCAFLLKRSSLAWRFVALESQPGFLTFQ